MLAGALALTACPLACGDSDSGPTRETGGGEDASSDGFVTGADGGPILPDGSSGNDGAGGQEGGSDGGPITLAPLPNVTAPTGNGHVVFHHPNGKHYRVEASNGATPQDLAGGLDGLSPGSDSRITISPDGKWLGLITSRFGCGANRCLAIAAYDFSYGEAIVTTSGAKITNYEGRVHVAPGGTLAVYTARGGPHSRDLWAVTRQPNGWTARALLSGSMSSAYASDPQISQDGTKVVFDCGPDPYSQTGTAVCEVGVNGSGFRVVSAPSDRPNGNANHHPSVAPDQSVVFEGNWSGERVWRSSSGGLSQIGNFGNDNTPCVLPDGRIASLWLQRPGGPSYHELKIMNGDGSNDFMLVINLDIIDDGLTCGP